MEKKNKSKLKIIFITGGALLACTAALIGGIAIAGNIEENKIVKTAYNGDGLKKANSDTIEVANTKVGDLSDSTSQANEDELLTTNENNTTNENISDSTPEAAGEPAVESEAIDDTSSESTTQEQVTITEDEAKSIVSDFLENLFGEAVDKTLLTASLESTHMGVIRKYWSIENEKYGCSVDALSGDVKNLRQLFAYNGVDTDGSYDYNNILGDESYYTKTEEIVKKHLANGREIELIYIDAVQEVYGDNNTHTILVDCHVLMKSGPSYTLSLIGSEQELYWLFSYPTQKACVYGYTDEEEASQYPDFVPYKDGDTIVYSPNQQ